MMPHNKFESQMAFNKLSVIFDVEYGGANESMYVTFGAPYICHPLLTKQLTFLVAIREHCPK